MTTTSSPPYIALTWNYNTLGANFGGYNIYRRPARATAFPWTKIAAITVPTGYTPANVEAQHNTFRDYEAGWSLTGGQWQDGFDYTVTVISALTHLESPIVAFQSMIKQTIDTHPWVTSNQYPFLSFPISSMQMLEGSDAPAGTEFRIAGRDLAVVRTQLELPPRTWVIGSRVFDRVGEDPARLWRAAAASGAPFAVHTPRGDRLIGVLEAPQSLPHEDVGTWTLSGSVIETDRNAASVADHNLPAGVVLNGTTQYISVADNALLKPGSGEWSVCVYCAPPNAGISWIAKRDPGTGFGYAISRSASNQYQYFVSGPSASSSISITDATKFDGKLHSFIGASSSTSHRLYADGIQTGSMSLTHGGVDNTHELSVGADSAGPNFNALAPLVAFAIYPRFLSTAEAVALDAYWKGVPGVRPPANPVTFVDLRDTRTWDGTQVSTSTLDLSGNGRHGTLVAAPVTRGIPWDLDQIDRF